MHLERSRSREVEAVELGKVELDTAGGKVDVELPVATDMKSYHDGQG